MTTEFSKKQNKTETVYTLESATGGGTGTSAGNIASVNMPMGGVRKRGDNLIAQEADKKEVVSTSKPRNFVAKNATTGGAGAHVDKKRAQKQGNEKHKKPFAESADEYTTEKQIVTRIRQIMYDRKISGTDSNAGELNRLKAELKALRGQQSVSEGVGGNYLYHATSPAGLKGILQSGYIGAQQTAQPATDAQTKLPSVAVTRDWNFASGSSRSSEGVGQGAVIIFDRNSIESKYKTFGSSQSWMTKGLPNATANTPQIKKLAQLTKYKDANKNNKLDYDEVPAGSEFFKTKAGGEAEEAVVVPKGALPLKGSMIGFWVDPKSELASDPTIINDPRRLELAPGGTGRFVKAKQVMAEGMAQLSVQQLATISDQALDNAYHYGRSTPGNTFGWQANLKSAEFAKRMIDAGETDIEKISNAIHQGWNVTARAFVQNPDRFDDTEKLRAAGKLDAKLQQREKLMSIGYSQLPDDEQEKDRVVARALLQAIQGDQDVAEGSNSSPFNQEQNLRNKSDKELAELIQFWNRALEKNPEHKIAREQLGLIKMIRSERIGKKNMSEDHEIQMASSELQSIAKNAVNLLDLVRRYSEREGLQAWQQSKITKAADYLNSVLQSISGEQHDPTMAENFKDGKNPGRKGLAKRSGVNTGASVSSLRDTARHSSGEKQRMAHWLANMKSGRAKDESVAEGSTQKYEMMLRNGQVKKFVAKDDADARRIAAGHSAKSVIRMKGNVPGDKIGEQGVAEAEKKGLYYYVNKRKQAGTSRSASNPKAPTDQAWRDAAKTAKEEDVAEGERTMSRAAKGYEKYGKKGMQSLAKAGREGASEKKLDAIRDKHDNYNEAWSQKYKGSINCSHPKGFSQKAHCAGKKKHNEDLMMEMTCPDCGMCETHGNNMMEIKQRLDAKCWKGKHKECTKIKGGIRVNNCVPNESCDAYVQRLQAYLESTLMEKIPANAPVDVWVQDFQQADPQKYHQFRNKTPEKKAQMAVAASYAAKNPSKKKK